MPKTMTGTLLDEHLGVHHIGHKPTLTLGRQWKVLVPPKWSYTSPPPPLFFLMLTSKSRIVSEL